MTRSQLLAMAVVAVAVPSPGEATAASRVRCVEVPGTVEWSSSGIEVEEGDVVCLRAQALWSHGQEAGNINPYHGAAGYIFKQDAPQPIVPFPFTRVGSLIAKIGESGLAFPVEEDLCFIAENTPGDPVDLPSQLLFSMNDVSGGFDDNAGSSRVAVAVDAGRHARFGRPDRLGVEQVAEQLSRSGCLR